LQHLVFFPFSCTSGTMIPFTYIGLFVCYSEICLSPLVFSLLYIFCIVNSFLSLPSTSVGKLFIVFIYFNVFSTLDFICMIIFSFICH
jgi:hypothetical protein